MTLLVFGKTRQVARELQTLAPNAIYLGRAEADLSDPQACAAAIRAHRPAAIINAAAYTAVDAAESDEALATAINGAAPGAMARAAATLGVPLVHISTDYVFAGTGIAPWRPDDPVAPPNAYGRSKLAGETAVRAAGGAHAILRTSWVFSAHGTNFVKTMLRLSETRDTLSVVEDQIGGPTPARAIAAACLEISSQLCSAPEKSGTYHFSGTPDTSWKSVAEAIFEQSRRQMTVTGIPGSAYPTPATRPLNSRMDCTSLAQTFGIMRPDWAAGLRDVLRDLGAVP